MEEQSTIQSLLLTLKSFQNQNLTIREIVGNHFCAKHTNSFLINANYQINKNIQESKLALEEVCRSLQNSQC